MTREDAEAYVSKHNIDYSFNGEFLVYDKRTFGNLNDLAIYVALKLNGGLTRPNIVRETHIARTTAYDALNRLSLSNLVKKQSTPTGKIGRPLVIFQISA